MTQITSDLIHPARKGWKVLEPYHALVYFAPEAREAYKEIGLKGFWMGYFASRAAALGQVSPEVVAATFYNFHPRMVSRAIPDAWKFATPEKVLEARLGAADAALQRLLGAEILNSAQVEEAANLAREAVNGCEVAGRALFAAYRALDWPAQPHLILWHAATLLREYRGDGHIAALLAAGLDGIEPHLLIVAEGIVPREGLQPHRGWNDEEWAAAQTRLIEKGWLDEAGNLTEAGRQLRREVEECTDRLALPPWQHLGEKNYSRLFELVYPLSNLIVERDGIPVPNPMGLPWP
jgi:hypothetical protein